MYFILIVPAIAGTSARITATKRPKKTAQGPYLCKNSSALFQCSADTRRPAREVRKRGPSTRPISYPVESPMIAPIIAMGIKMESFK